MRYSYSLPKGNVRSGKDLIPGIGFGEMMVYEMTHVLSGAVSTKGGSAQNSGMVCHII